MKIRLQGIDYDLVSNDKSMGDINANGYFHFDSKEVSIKNSLPLDIQKSILIHELMESIDTHFELNLNHEVITQIASGFHQVIEDNPHLFTNKFKGVK